jgi:hypothetical protein
MIIVAKWKGKVGILHLLEFFELENQQRRVCRTRQERISTETMSGTPRVLPP